MFTWCHIKSDLMSFSAGQKAARKPKLVLLPLFMRPVTSGQAFSQGRLRWVQMSETFRGTSTQIALHNQNPHHTWTYCIWYMVTFPSRITRRRNITPPLPHSLANIWGSFGFPQSLNSGESSPKLITMMMMMMMINDDSYYHDDETMTMMATIW